MTLLTLLIGVYILQQGLDSEDSQIHFSTYSVLSLGLYRQCLHPPLPMECCSFFHQCLCFRFFFQNSLKLSVLRFNSLSCACHQYFLLADCTCLSKAFYAFLITAFSLCLCAPTALYQTSSAVQNSFHKTVKPSATMAS